MEDQEAGSCWPSSQGKETGREPFLLAGEPIWQEQKNSWLDLWGPVWLKDLKEAHEISNLATHG